MWNILTTKSCQKCEKSFDINQNDRDFYTKVSPVFAWKKYQIPDPTICPECRQQRRLLWKNELQLYKNICDWCGTNIVSRFHEKSKIMNYCNKCWSSDNWDAHIYGRDVDFTRPIFEQIWELINETPFQNLIGSLSNIENNAVYTNCTADIKNSYMVSESDYVEDCYYGRLLQKSHDLFDCLGCSNSEYCYESIHSDGLYKCFFVRHSTTCRDMIYGYDCHWCSDCIWCVWLGNKQYCVLNQQLTEEEFKKELDGLETNNDLVRKFQEMSEEHSKGQEYIVSSENCSGSIIVNSSNCHHSVWVLECQDVSYSEEINYSQDLYDISSYGSNSYLMYEWLWVGRYSHDVLFSSTVGRWEHLIYCVDTKKSQHCFACVNMKDAKYCILNKQYSREEYEALVPQIIEYMEKHGEWWEFFSASLSPFGYNETLVNERISITKNEAQSKWWNWSEYETPLPKVDKIISATKLPKNISKVPDDILNWAVECEITKKPFRIIKQELAFYRKHQLPIPRRHPDQRRMDRLSL